MVQLTDHRQFCDDANVEKKRAVEEINEQLKALESDVEKYTTTAAKLTKEIAEHEKDTSVWNDDVRSTTEVRWNHRNEWYDRQRENWWYNNNGWDYYK